MKHRAGRVRQLISKAKYLVTPQRGRLTLHDTETDVIEDVEVDNGGPGSGNFGHGGRPGERGGSSSEGPLKEGRERAVSEDVASSHNRTMRANSDMMTAALTKDPVQAERASKRASEHAWETSRLASGSAADRTHAADAHRMAASAHEMAAEIKGTKKTNHLAAAREHVLAYKKIEAGGRAPVRNENEEEGLVGPNGIEGTEGVQTILESFTANIREKLVRSDTMEGRKYTVVPMVMMVEGVHAGSQGALYYSANELKKVPESWNHKPIVAPGHPTKDGSGVSACTPDMISKYKIGVIMNTRFDKLGRLVAEAWLDDERVAAVDKRVADAVAKVSTLELSTGMFMDIDPKDGEWQGEKYVGVARNFRPDHLAVLPDKTGACSVKKGAGFIRNEAEDQEDEEELATHGGPGSGNFGHGGRPGERGGSVGGDAGVEADASAQDPEYINRRDAAAKAEKKASGPFSSALAAIKHGSAALYAEKKGWKSIAEEHRKAEKYHAQRSERLHKADLAGNEEEPRNFLTRNELSFDNIREALNKAITERFPAPLAGLAANPSYISSPWVCAVYNTFAIFSQGSKLFKIGYSATETKVVLSKDKPVEVVRVTEFRTVDGAFVGNAAANCDSDNDGSKTNDKSKKKGKPNMDKKQMVDNLIKNHGWSDGDRDTLMAFNEEQLARMTPKDAPKAPATLEEYINAAPAPVQDVLRAGVAAHNAAKETLIGTITANEANKFTKEQLAAMPLATLEAVASLAKVKPAPAAEPAKPVANAEQKKEDGKPANFGGQGEPAKPAPVTNAADKGPGKILLPPSMTFDKK